MVWIEGFIGWLIEHKFVLLFYFFVYLSIYVFRRKFEFQLKFIALYRTQLGIKLMDTVAGSFRTPVIWFGYASVYIGFLGMVLIIGLLGFAAIQMILVESAPPAIAPVLPGIRIPGNPINLPLVEGILAIFIIAAIHEFSHGVVARAHNIKVKSSGIVFFGPLLGAFVEPDEKQLAKKSNMVQYSMFASGPVSNILLAFLVLLFIGQVFAPIVQSSFEPIGVTFNNIDEEQPAYQAGIRDGTFFNKINGEPFLTVNDYMTFRETIEVGDSITLSNDETSFEVVTSQHPNDDTIPYIGVFMEQNVNNQDSLYFSVAQWLRGFLFLLFILNLGIGMGNLIPIAIFDGGRMFKLALVQITGKEEISNHIWSQVSIFLFIFLFVLLIASIIRGINLG